MLKKLKTETGVISIGESLKQNRFQTIEIVNVDIYYSISNQKWQKHMYLHR